MTKVESDLKQVNQCNKIQKENLEAILPGLIKDLFGIDPCLGRPSYLMIMDSIADYISEKKDIIYILGEEIGKWKAQTEFVKNLLSTAKHTDIEIAVLVGVTEAFVTGKERALLIPPPSHYRKK